jgi:hypothetical protein
MGLYKNGTAPRWNNPFRFEGVVYTDGKMLPPSPRVDCIYSLQARMGP